MKLVLQDETHPSIFVALTGLAGTGKSSQLLHLPLTLEEQARFQAEDNRPSSIIRSSMNRNIAGGPLLFATDLKEVEEMPDSDTPHSAEEAAAILLLAAFLRQRSPREYLWLAMVQLMKAYSPLLLYPRVPGV